jgi:hypothetical protein
VVLLDLHGASRQEEDLSRFADRDELWCVFHFISPYVKLVALSQERSAVALTPARTSVLYPVAPGETLGSSTDHRY